MIVIDSSVVISVIHESISISELKKFVQDEDTYAITAPTMYELYFGLFKLKRKKGTKINQKKWEQEEKAIEKMSSILPILPFTLTSARISADIYTKLISKGNFIEILDCMIAGTAISHDFFRILTSNVIHFERITNLEVIQFPN